MSNLSIVSNHVKNIPISPSHHLLQKIPENHSSCLNLRSQQPYELPRSWELSLLHIFLVCPQYADQRYANRNVRLHCQLQRRGSPISCKSPRKCQTPNLAEHVQNRSIDRPFLCHLLLIIICLFSISRFVSQNWVQWLD